MMAPDASSRGFRSRRTHAIARNRVRSDLGGARGFDATATARRALAGRFCTRFNAVAHHRVAWGPKPTQAALAASGAPLTDQCQAFRPFARRGLICLW